MRFLRDLRPAAFAMAPWTAAILTLAAGRDAAGLGRDAVRARPLHAADPDHAGLSDRGQPLPLQHPGPGPGAAGLRPARAGSTRPGARPWAPLLLGATLALLKGFNWEETAALVALAVLLAPFHGAFPRTLAADPDGDHAGLAVLGRLRGGRRGRCWASGPSSTPTTPTGPGGG